MEISHCGTANYCCTVVPIKSCLYADLNNFPHLGQQKAFASLDTEVLEAGPPRNLWQQIEDPSYTDSRRCRTYRNQLCDYEAPTLSRSYSHPSYDTQQRCYQITRATPPITRALSPDEHSMSRNHQPISHLSQHLHTEETQEAPRVRREKHTDRKRRREGVRYHHHPQSSRRPKSLKKIESIQ